MNMIYIYFTLNNILCEDGNSIINVNESSTIDNTGTINNHDEIIIIRDSSINNDDFGVINNHAKLTLDSSFGEVSLNNFGIINTSHLVYFALLFWIIKDDIILLSWLNNTMIKFN